MVEGAWTQYKNQGLGTTNTAFTNLTPYMNYVNVDTAYTFSGVSCAFAATTQCLRLHDGGVLFSWFDTAFGGTSDANYFMFAYDPTPGTDGSTDRLWFVLTYPGRVATSQDYGVAPANPAWWKGWS